VGAWEEEQKRVTGETSRIDESQRVISTGGNAVKREVWARGSAGLVTANTRWKSEVEGGVLLQRRGLGWSKKAMLDLSRGVCEDFKGKRNRFQ